jgi:hypothetical protein
LSNDNEKKHEHKLILEVKSEFELMRDSDNELFEVNELDMVYSLIIIIEITYSMEMRRLI